MIKSRALFICFFACVLALQTSASPKMTVYWGQNSNGAEESLRTYCSSSSYDIIVVGFVYLFPSASGNADATLPGLNFANHCETPFNSANPFFLDCRANIAPDITYCQQQGKTILLSFGGGVGQYGFANDAAGITFATTVWNLFLGGTAPLRPFGDVIFDGVDLDIEGGSQAGYIGFTKQLRQYFAASGRKYYISAAPQCFYPDRLGPGSGTPLTEGWFDYIWIQFYNNHCGLDAYPSNFNFAQWVTGISNSLNPNVKLFIGAPAGPQAAGSGYVSVSTLQTIATAINNAYPSVYGGIMIWDAGNSAANSNFGDSVASFVHSQSSGSVSPPSSASTTGRVSTPSTTGKSTPATTGKTMAATKATTASIAGANPIPSATGASSGANSESCTLGYQRCAGSNSYQVCGNGPNGHVWAAVQSCQTGLSCHPSATANNIYCY